jgi:hypothetical protein
LQIYNIAKDRYFAAENAARRVYPPFPVKYEGNCHFVKVRDLLTWTQGVEPQAAATPPPPSVLNVSDDGKTMCLSAGDKEISFRYDKKGKPSKEMQIVRTLIAKHPKGATVAELMGAAWPGEQTDPKVILRLIAMMGTLREKAQRVGLPKDIFPEITNKTIKASPKAKYELTCRTIEGAEELRRRRDFSLHARPGEREEQLIKEVDKGENW